MRPGCDRPASARVAFDPVALQLWLDPLPRQAAPVQELCAFHIERLTVPRGWTATDRRPNVANADVAAPVAVEPTVVEPPVVEPAVVEPAVVEPAVVEPAVVEPPVVEPAASTEPPPSRRRSGRRPGRGEEPSLLSRAFALSGPQESVLTSRPKDERQ